MWSWKNETELMAELQLIQNLPKNRNKDIMSFIGFIESREELIDHIERNK